MAQPNLINNRWKGMLTTKNIGAVAQMFNTMFARRRFTHTTIRPSLVTHADLEQVIDTDVVVFTGVKLLKKINGQKIASVTIHLSKNRATLAIYTSENLCEYTTDLDVVGADYDYTHKNPHVAFDGDRMTIRHQTPCGDQKVDVFIIEHR